MINIDVARSGPGSSIIIAVPSAGRGSTSTARLYIRAVALQNGLARVASAADGDPVLELIAIVGWTVVLGFDGEL